MKYLLLLLSLTIAAAAQTATPAPKSTEDKSAKLIQMENEWLKAGSEGNNAAIRAMLAQNWMAMAPGGNILHTDAFEEDSSESRLPKLTMQDSTVEFYGTTAVLMAHLVPEKAGPGFNVTTVFQDRLGKWEMIATHLSAQEEHGSQQGGSQ
jgi:uncharacterized protein DUF4440